MGCMSAPADPALARVDAFIASHPDYSRDGIDPPGQGATIRVFYARRYDERVVFKVFCDAERKERECFALKHWQSTGLVPRLLWDDDPCMIVMSFVPGDWLHRRRETQREEWL